MSTNATRTKAAVIAIIVTHDGARLLPSLVRALKAQTHPVKQTVGVDTGSSDGSRAVLAGLIGQDAVLGVDRSTGFGEAVATALRHATGRRSGQSDAGLSAGRAGAEWIWLLHDDCEPAPDALEQLLRAAGRDRAVVVVGPKVLDGQDRRTLREVGVSIDRAGRRITGVDPDEIDQGQHDHKRSVLAVSSAGMLVRRDVWDRLGGFDPNLKFFRDDVDFCWRVQAAGLRVQVATDAALYHWELAGQRRRQVQGGSMPVLDRRNALFVLAVNLPLIAMLRIVGGSVLGSLARALYFLLTKQLDLSAAYAFSVLGLFAHPVQLVKARRRRAKGLAEGYYAVRIFIPPARTLAKLAEQTAGFVSNGPSRGRHQVAAEESEGSARFVGQVSVARRIIGHPGVQLFFALLLVTLIATRRLLGTSPLGGGALVPAWGGALALWQEYLAGFHAVSVGSSAAAPPYLAVVAFLATLLGGQAWLAVDVLLLGCVPLAGVTAYLATRGVVTAIPARVLLAASYALLPVATGAVAAGRLGTAAAFVLLPLIAASAGRMLTAAPRRARRAAWATGLLIAFAAAFAPLTWLLGVVFAVAVVGVRRWLAAVDPVNAAIVAVTPFFVLFPWSLHLLASPSSFGSEAGLAAPNLTTHGLSATALLALSPGGPGVPPVWVTAGFALALVALVLPPRRPAVVIGGWAVAVAGLLTAVTLSRMTVTPPAGGQPADGWPGVATALAGLGLLLATAPAAQWLATIMQNGSGTLPSATSASGRGQRSRRLLATAALIGAATAPLFVAAYWVTDGVRGPVGSVSGQLLPTFMSASSASGTRYRTLILRPRGAVLDYQVVRQGDPSLGGPELGVPASAEAALSRQVAALGARDGADAGDPGLVLGSFGIKWVMLPGPVDQVLASRLDASPGLVALNQGPSYDVWQVTGPVGQVRVVAPSGATTVLSSATGGLSGATAPASGGTLVLAEPYGGWTATLNGRALKPVATPVSGWAQGFVLPPGGGQLSITHNGLSRLLSVILELVATLAVIVAALPGKRADPAEETEALAALREAKASAAGQRTDGASRLRSGAGHRAVNRAISGVGRLGLGRLRLGPRHGPGRTPADDGPPESPPLGNQSPAEADAAPAEAIEAVEGMEAAGATATAIRTEWRRGRHAGAVAGADDSTGAGDTDTGASVPGPALAPGAGDLGTSGAGGTAGSGGLPVDQWEMTDAGDRLAPAPARQSGEQALAPEHATPGASTPGASTPGASTPGASTPGSSRWGTGFPDKPGSSAGDAGRRDDGDWLAELLRGAGVDRQPSASAPAAPEASSWGTDYLNPLLGPVTGARQEGDPGWRSAAQESAQPESPPWAADPVDTSRRLPGPEQPDDSVPRRTSSWKGALARLTGQQPAVPENPRVDPALDAPTPSADAGRRDDSDWLDELLRKNGVSEPPPVAESPASVPSRGPADPLDTAKPSPDAVAHDDSDRPGTLARRSEPGRKDDQVRRGGRHAAVPGNSSQPSPPAASPRESSRPESPALGSPATGSPVSGSPVSGSLATGSPATGSPVSEAPAPDSRPPWEIGPRRAPWDSGPQSPVSAPGAQPRKPWESGPQARVTPTGAEASLPADTQPAWRTDAESAWGTGPLPGARSGKRPVSRTGAQPTFTPTGPRPTSSTTGGQATPTPAGAAPASPPVIPPDQPGTPPVGKAPWESGNWGKAAGWDAIGGDQDAVTAAREPGDANQAGAGNQAAGAPAAESGSASGRRAAASPPAKPERHSHRGGKHGKPSRWRGPGNRPGDGRDS